MTDQFDNHPTEPVPSTPQPERDDVTLPRLERGDSTSSPAAGGQGVPGEATPEAAGTAAAEPLAAGPESAAPGTPGTRRGQVRYQDPATARPRPPSLAEQRARQVAERERRRKEIAEAAEADRKSKLRRRLMIGGGVTVGVVALVAIWYAASRPKEVTAYCVADNDVVTDDTYCDQRYVTTTGGGYYSGGFFFVGGRQYHYYYGGNPTPLGQHVSGGSTVKPQGASITTRSGKTIQRGGFGIRGGSGKSSGG